MGTEAEFFVGPAPKKLPPKKIVKPAPDDTPVTLGEGKRAPGHVADVDSLLERMLGRGTSPEQAKSMREDADMARHNAETTARRLQKLEEREKRRKR
jgi:hypothetical protein